MQYRIEAIDHEGPWSGKYHRRYSEAEQNTQFKEVPIFYASLEQFKDSRRE